METKESFEAVISQFVSYCRTGCNDTMFVMCVGRQKSAASLEFMLFSVCCAASRSSTFGTFGNALIYSFPGIRLQIIMSISRWTTQDFICNGTGFSDYLFAKEPYFTREIRSTYSYSLSRFFFSRQKKRQICSNYSQ